MSKRVLVTGSAGFVGSHIVEHILANTDWEVVGIDSFRHRGDSMRVHKNLDPDRYKIFTHDLTTPISNIMSNAIGHIDYIIQNASESHVDRSIEDDSRRAFVENNVNVALTMLEYAYQVKPEKYIHVSTDEVYGPALNGHNHKEWETHLPSNPYSGSKAAQVDISISYWRTLGIPLIITETMNIIGERQDSEKFVPMLIQKIYKGEEVTIHGTEGDIGSRFYLHARNQADGLLYLLKYINPMMYEDSTDYIVKPSRYNIVGELELNNLELAQMVADIIGKPLNYKLENFHACRPGHDRRYALDGSKMNKILWKPPVPFRKSLEKIIEWTFENKEWLE
jgi:dTDP-glucose 4,6-dehydratase